MWHRPCSWRYFDSARMYSLVPQHSFRQSAPWIYRRRIRLANSFINSGWDVSHLFRRLWTRRHDLDHFDTDGQYQHKEFCWIYDRPTRPAKPRPGLTVGSVRCIVLRHPHPYINGRGPCISIFQGTQISIRYRSIVSIDSIWVKIKSIWGRADPNWSISICQSILKYLCIMRKDMWE